MRELDNTTVLAVFVIALLILIGAIGLSSESPKDLVTIEFALQSLTHAVGILLVVLAGLRLLIHNLEGLSVDQFAVYLAVLLGGTLLIEPHWTVVITLGLIILAVIAKEIIMRFSSSSNGGDTSSTASGPGERGSSGEGQ